MIVFVVSIICVSSSFGTEWYVDNLRGDDLNDGLAPAGSPNGSLPFRTITRALRGAQAGDSISLAKNDEPYHESITLEGPNNSGFLGYPFTLKGNGSVIDGTGEISSDAWQHVIGNVFRFRPMFGAFQQLYHEGKPLTRFSPQGKFQPNQIPELNWALMNGYIYFCSQDGKLPQQYGLRCCKHGVGVTLFEVHDVVITDLTVQGFRLDGVNAHDDATGVTIMSSISRGNGRSGISVGGASKVNVIACLIGNNSIAQLRNENQGRTELFNCDLVESNDSVRIQIAGGRVRNDDKPVNETFK
jgi:Right handed beta helix region